ncbi:MAG: DMT family transporter [Novosphingobium sp.]|uniref:DMT family transporter n=1 Tax=Novosphingobium sp. TaxID=1874826 RepID=UPI0032BB1BDA
MVNATGAIEQAAPRWTALHFAALLGGNVALAVGPWFVRQADSGPVSAGFWRLLLAVPLLFALAFWNREKVIGYRPSTWLAIAGAGVFFGLDIASWHIGIGMTRMANATLFGNSGSLVVIAVGLYALHRTPRRNEWLAFALAIAGSAVLLGRSLEIGRTTLVGDLFCITAGLLYAGYILLLQKPRAHLGSWSLVAWSSVAGAPIMLATALLVGEPVWPTLWWPLVALALLGQVTGQGLLIYAMRHFTPLVFGLALLTQPAIAVALGWLAFGEALVPVDFLGMVMVGTGLALARSAQD